MKEQRVTKKCLFCDNDAVERVRAGRDFYDLCSYCMKGFDENYNIVERRVRERRQEKRRKEDK